MQNFLTFLYLPAFKISCSIELSMKRFYNLRAWLVSFDIKFIRFDQKQTEMAGKPQSSCAICDLIR